MAPPQTPTSGPTVVRVGTPGELIVAIPVLLGFHPRESLVLLATGGRSGRRLGLTLRVDLPPPEHLAEVARTAVHGLLTDAAVGAAVIVVTGRGRDDPLARELVDLVVAGLQERSVDVHTVIRADSTAAGARWECYESCGCSGLLPEPSTTPFAATAVAGGQVVFAGRSELEGLVAPADGGRIRRRELALIRAADEALAADPVAAAGDPGPDPVEAWPGAGTAVVDAAIADAAAGRLELDDARVVALAGALAAPAVRDAAMLRCAAADSVTAAAAEHLWAALARETPDPEAAEPAALLAVSALLRGDGALANVALDRAERAWPGHRLTALLRSVTEVGMRPGELRAVLGAGAPGPGARGARPRRARRGAR